MFTEKTIIKRIINQVKNIIIIRRNDQNLPQDQDSWKLDRSVIQHKGPCLYEILLDENKYTQCKQENLDILLIHETKAVAKLSDHYYILNDEKYRIFGISGRKAQVSQAIRITIKKLYKCTITGNQNIYEVLLLMTDVMFGLIFNSGDGNLSRMNFQTGCQFTCLYNDDSKNKILSVRGDLDRLANMFFSISSLML